MKTKKKMEKRNEACNKSQSLGKRKKRPIQNAQSNCVS